MFKKLPLLPKPEEKEIQISQCCRSFRRQIKGLQIDRPQSHLIEKPKA